jgi:hypothetical protein
MDYFHSRESLNTANSGALWKNVVKPILKDNHDKFLKELTREQIQIFEHVSGDMLLELGYSAMENSAVLSLGEQDIERFNKENQERIKRALLQADAEDRAKRKPQEDLLLQIKSRTL